MGGLIGLAALLFSTQVDLAQFGLKSADEIGYVSIGVSHSEKGEQVRVYDVRKEGPAQALIGQIVARDPAPDARAFVVSRFDEGNRNALDGYFNVFNLPPARSKAYLSGSQASDPSLIFEFERKSDRNYSGFWVQLFDSRVRPEDRVYFDASPYAYLTFQIRSEKPGISFILKAADAKLNAREDAKFIGNLADFLPQKSITTTWQTARVPLSRFDEELDRKSLANLVFQANDLSGTLFVKELSFLKTEQPPALPRQSPAAKERSVGRAMWLWETAKLERDNVKIDELLRFAKRVGLTDIFVQVPYQATFANNRWRIEWNEKATRPLIRKLNAAGLSVHALDGDPSFGLQKYHGRQLALVQRIIDFNKAGPMSERFAGIRYDDEIYLLPNFYGNEKQRVLSELVELLKKTKSLTSKAALEFGVDVPFWFDARNAFGEYEAPYNGESVMTAILNIVDNIGIMDYRTVAYGADGVIAHAEQKMIEAEKLKKRVFVGLETVQLPDETIYEFLGVPKAPSGNLMIASGPQNLISFTWLSEAKPDPARKELALFRQTEVPGSKMTFHAMPTSDLNAVISETERELSRYSSFAGVVLHSYESLLPYLGRSEIQITSAQAKK